jgi:p-aminobenzoyl-glutamate transporter AbgT
VGLPDAILFLRISREGVFQQPRLISPTIGYNLDSTEEPVSAMSKSVWRAVIEVGFIIFLFYSNLLMGEFEHSGIGRTRGVAWAIEDAFTVANFGIALVAALIGYVLVESLRKKF